MISAHNIKRHVALIILNAYLRTCRRVYAPSHFIFSFCGGSRGLSFPWYFLIPLPSSSSQPSSNRVLVENNVSHDLMSNGLLMMTRSGSENMYGKDRTDQRKTNCRLAVACLSTFFYPPPIQFVFTGLSGTHDPDRLFPLPHKYIVFIINLWGRG